ncbi:hypothetical protein SAMN04489731_107435 [Amycolatopsis regifaucium]|nr:hypothetical protein SAMN04489731_107435 [Amycolatopsis regifaucium]
MQGLTRETGEVNGDHGFLERTLKVRPEVHRALRAFPNEDTAALARHDETFVSKQANCLLDGHPSNAEPLRQLGSGRQLLTSLEGLRQDRRSESIRYLLVRRARVIWVQLHELRIRRNGPSGLASLDNLLTWLAMLGNFKHA